MTAYSRKDPPSPSQRAVRRALAAGVDAYWYHGAVAAELVRYSPQCAKAISGNLRGDWPSMDVLRWLRDLERVGIVREVSRDEFGPWYEFIPEGE